MARFLTELRLCPETQKAQPVKTAQYPLQAKIYFSFA